jgi:hypothetical protein
MLKKVIFTILFTVFCALPIFAATPIWHQFDGGPNIKMYIDSANISKTEDYAVIWTKNVMPNYYYLMQWLIIRDGHISCIYSRTYRPGGGIDEEFMGSKLRNSPISQSTLFKELYKLAW